MPASHALQDQIQEYNMNRVGLSALRVSWTVVAHRAAAVVLTCGLFCFFLLRALLHKCQVNDSSWIFKSLRVSFPLFL